METVAMGGRRWRHVLYAAMRGERRRMGWAQPGLMALSLATPGYRVARCAEALSYTVRLRRRHRLPCRVVSIGNLTLGGTGKTPLTIWTARWLQHQGWRVAVLSRGYGGQAVGRARVVSEGKGPVCDWIDVGDEPYLLAQELPGVPVLIGTCRVASGHIACERFGAQVVVLDDGFQYHALQRDLDIVLIDATNPFGSGALLPRGILREPLQALRRASILVLTRTELAGERLPTLLAQLRRWHGHHPIYRTQTVVNVLRDVEDGTCEETALLHRRRIVAFAGIGHPGAFAATLRQQGYEVVAFLVFPDHHRYTVSDWQAIVENVHRYGGECMVTTTKDAVRLDPSWSAPTPFYTVQADVTFVPDDKSFAQQLRALMQQ